MMLLMVVILELVSLSSDSIGIVVVDDMNCYYFDIDEDDVHRRCWG